MFEAFLSFCGTSDGVRCLIYAGYLSFMCGVTGVSSYLDTVFADSEGAHADQLDVPPALKASAQALGRERG